MRRRFSAVLGLGLVAAVVSGPESVLLPAQPSQAPPSATPTTRPASPLVGTWRLVSIERRGANGALLPPAKPPAFGSPNPVGLMMYDPAGYVGVAVMQSGRQKYAGSEPTPAEAKAAFESHISFFGTHAITAGTKTVVFRVDGSLNPNLTNTEYANTFDVVGDRLTLKPPLTSTGTQDTLVWERVPPLQSLTPTHRRLTGFWKLVPNDGDKTEATANQDPRRGFIIYSDSGNMAVHIMPAGRARFKGETPTPDEAKAAMRAYTNYFGPYTIDEGERYIVHQRIAHTIPASIGTNAQRFYEFVGKRLVLRLFSTTFTVPTTMRSAKTEGREPSMITWERISAEP
jgi:hypothetical protein